MKPVAQEAKTSRVVSAVPDLLSVFRLGLAACFPLVHPGWRLAVVAAAALSDWLDGLVARRYATSSFRGGLLDAIADKLFVFTVLVTLTAGGQLAWWQAVLVLGRDLTVAGVAAAAAVKGEWAEFRRMGVRRLGRVTTAAQFLLFGWVLLPWAGADRLDPVFVAAASGLSILAAGDYLLRLQRVLAERRPSG